MISFDDFEKVEIRAGEIIRAEMNSKAKKPAYVLTIDFGIEIGIKTSSAQLVANYTMEDLIGRQVLAVMNFPEKNIAGVQSQVLVLATIDEKNGAILLQPERKVENGSRVY